MYILWIECHSKFKISSFQFLILSFNWVVREANEAAHFFGSFDLGNSPSCFVDVGWVPCCFTAVFFLNKILSFIKKERNSNSKTYYTFKAQFIIYNPF